MIRRIVLLAAVAMVAGAPAPGRAEDPARRPADSAPPTVAPPAAAPPAADATAPAAADEPAPPVPPLPPRLSDSADYQHCLQMIANDPSGANTFADAWFATGGGAPALHCQGLAEIALGDPQSGAALIEKAVEASTAPPTARAAVLGQAIQAWIMADDPARAYDNASKAVALAPEDVDLWIDRSIAAATMERYYDAIDDLDHALTLAPDRADALVFRAAAWRNEGKLDRAKTDIDRAVTLDPDNAEALLERGIQRQRAGDADGARADWQRAKELAPDTATADLAEQNLALLEAGPVNRP